MKKIYYVPGLISAIVIPLLFLYYGNKKYNEINISLIDLWISPKLSKDKNNYEYTFEPLRNWNYKKIKVEPGTAKKNSELYVSEIEALQKRKERNTGIEFILDKNNTYEDFVSLLNDMAIAKHETYAYDLEKTGHLFVTYSYIDPKLNLYSDDIIRCGTMNMEQYYRNEYFLKGFDKFTYQMTQLPKEFYYIFFGFLLLINISMFSIKERLQL